MLAGVASAATAAASPAASGCTSAAATVACRSRGGARTPLRGTCSRTQAPHRTLRRLVTLHLLALGRTSLCHVLCRLLQQQLVIALRVAIALGARAGTNTQGSAEHSRALPPPLLCNASLAALTSAYSCCSPASVSPLGLL